MGTFGLDSPARRLGCLMRLYNGCPDSQLKAIWDSRERANREARDLGYCITYFPMEAKYGAARLSDWAETGPLCDSVEECLIHIKIHIATEED